VGYLKYKNELIAFGSIIGIIIITLIVGNIQKIFMTAEQKEEYKAARQKIENRFTMEHTMLTKGTILGILTDNQTGKEYLYVSKGGLVPLETPDEVTE